VHHSPCWGPRPRRDGGCGRQGELGAGGDAVPAACGRFHASPSSSPTRRPASPSPTTGDVTLGARCGGAPRRPATVEVQGGPAELRCAGAGHVRPQWRARSRTSRSWPATALCTCAASASGSGQAGERWTRTVFQLASVSKSFTSTMLAALVTEREIAWDDPVHQVLAGVRAVGSMGEPARHLRDLMAQRTGLPSTPATSSCIRLRRERSCAGSVPAAGRRFPRRLRVPERSAHRRREAASARPAGHGRSSWREVLKAARHGLHGATQRG